MKPKKRFSARVERTPGLGQALRAFLLCAGFCVLPGCSDVAEDEEDEEVDPVAACNTYASTWCNRSLNCYAQVGRIDQSEADQAVPACVSVIVERLPCSAASSVEADYDTCISQIKGMACSRWNVPRLDFGNVKPPTSCETALGYE